ncbi:MAG: endonuclease/exonuclease/phosphatase family protein [Pirellulaceae bacterium]|nr:endonuclease/exonuclease/phosphatase family protein [Pirellulaceae bacterium]
MKLKLLLWNVEWSPSESRQAKIRSVWKAYDPDLVCITEGIDVLFKGQSNVISSGDNYGYLNNGDRRKVWLWSRFGWDEVDTVGSKELPPGRFVSGVTNGIRVVGVCIPWQHAHVSTGNKNRAAWQDHISYLDALRDILSRYAQDALPICLVGDFNQRIPPGDANSQVYKRLAAALGTNLTIRTAGILDVDGKPLIDHIATTESLSFKLDKTIGRKSEDGEHLSDHPAILSTLSHRNSKRIGTWNLEYAYEKRLDAVRKVLDKNRADIWILTETHDDLVPPNCPYVAHSEPRPKNWSGIRDGSRWVSIWSKYAIIEKITTSSGDPERTVIALLDLGNEKTMLVYGTVLPWKGDRGIQDWSEHHRVIPEQAAEWSYLRQKYPDVPLCVAGDYNTDMGTGSYYGTKQGIAALRNGLAESELFCATAPDFFPKELLPNLPIDHIALPIVWKELTSVVAAWPAAKKELSDHSGMIVEVVCRKC